MLKLRTHPCAAKDMHCSERHMLANPYEKVHAQVLDEIVVQPRVRGVSAGPLVAFADAGA